MIRRPPISPLFPSTTLFRSLVRATRGAVRKEVSKRPPPADRQAVQVSWSPRLAADDPHGPLARRPLPASLVPALFAVAAGRNVRAHGHAAVRARHGLGRRLRVPVIEQDGLREGARVEARLEQFEAGARRAVLVFAALWV